jgi:long-chain fatty acid transport protein
MMKKGVTQKFCLVLLVLLFATTRADAAGFGVFTQGASGLGQANAVVAHPIGPSSLYFNPALLTQVPGTQVEAGTTAVFSDREFKSSLTGRTEESEEEVQFPSTFYLAHQFNDQVTAGLGVFFPFGLSTEWDENWDGRYIATNSDLFTTNINPVVAWRPIPQLSVAAGLDVLYLDAELERKVNSTVIGFVANPPGGLVPLSDVNQKFTGDGWGVGYNLGLALQVSENIDFGATYRSHVDVNVDGDARFDVPADATAAGLGQFFPKTGGDADIRLPAQATFGLAWAATERLTLEAGARWEDWSSFDELKIELDQPILQQSENITPRDWNDTWAFNLGGQYRLNDVVTLLAGYLYAENPVPDSTFDPSIPDSDAHLFTLGTDLTFGRFSVSLAYGYEHHEDRTKNNAIGDPLDPSGLNPLSSANGEYKTDIHLVATSVAYRF